MAELREVQAPMWTEMRRKSDTESGRTLLKFVGLYFDEDDSVVEPDGSLVAYTLEDATAAMIELGWVTPANWRTDFNPIPHEEDGGFGRKAADRIRSVLDSDGKYESRWS